MTSAYYLLSYDNWLLIESGLIHLEEYGQGMKMLSGARSYVKLSEFGHFWCLRYSEHSILQSVCQIRKSVGKRRNQGNVFCLKILGKNQGIQLMLETIREINRFSNMVKK